MRFSQRVNVPRRGFTARVSIAPAVATSTISRTGRGECRIRITVRAVAVVVTIAATSVAVTIAVTVTVTMTVVSVVVVISVVNHDIVVIVVNRDAIVIVVHHHVVIVVVNHTAIPYHMAVTNHRTLDVRVANDRTVNHHRLFDDRRHVLRLSHRLRRLYDFLGRGIHRRFFLEQRHTHVAVFQIAAHHVRPVAFKNDDVLFGVVTRRGGNLLALLVDDLEGAPVRSLRHIQLNVQELACRVHRRGVTRAVRGLLRDGLDLPVSRKGHCRTPHESENQQKSECSVHGTTLLEKNVKARCKAVLVSLLTVLYTTVYLISPFFARRLTKNSLIFAVFFWKSTD